MRDADAIRAKRLMRSMKRLDIAVQTRSFEIDLFWKRSLFFWGFIATAFGGFAALRGPSPDLAIIVACFGLVCSVAWTLINRGSKYWQEAWEQKVEAEEVQSIGSLFQRQEPIQDKGPWLSARRFSVTKLTIALSDYALILWLCALALSVAERICVLAPITISVAMFIFVTFSLVYAVSLLWAGRSTVARNKGPM